MSNDVSVRVIGDDKSFDSTMDRVDSRVGSTADKMERAGGRLTRGLTLPILGAGAAAVHLAGEQEVAEAKVESAFESMGAASWTTVEALKAQASAFQDVSTFGDEAVLDMQSVLLTFGNVTDQVGEGNDVFTRASQLGLDMSAALGQDLQSSAIMLGKALNDPIAGLTALTRVGVSFDEQQKEQIRTLAESGDTLGAQQIMLEALEMQFEGTAQAVADTSQGQMKQAMNDLGDAAESLGAIIVPVLSTVAGWLSTAAKAFQNLSPEAQKVITVILGVAAAVGPMLIIGAKLIKMWQAVKVAFIAVKVAMMANPFIAIAAAVVALVILVVANWDKIKTFLFAAWDAIKAAATKTWEWIRDRFQAVWNFLVGLFKLTPLGFLIDHFDEIKRIATGVATWFTDTFNGVVTFFAGLPARIGAAVHGMWNGLVDGFFAAVNFIVDAWNKIDFEIGPFAVPDWVPIFGGNSFHIPDLFPDVPRLHEGGVFRAPKPGGEGLALLLDGERVVRPGGEAGGPTVMIEVNGFVGDEQSLAEEIDRVLTRRAAFTELGFQA